MPLIDAKATVKVEIGKDWYELRQCLGFYQKLEIDRAAFTFEFPPNWDGKQMDKIKAVPNHAERDFSKLSGYLAAWSHKDELNEDNIKRIPPQDAKILLDKIKELEANAPQPFRGKPKAT